MMNSQSLVVEMTCLLDAASLDEHNWKILYICTSTVPRSPVSRWIHLRLCSRHTTWPQCSHWSDWLHCGSMYYQEWHIQLRPIRDPPRLFCSHGWTQTHFHSSNQFQQIWDVLLGGGSSSRTGAFIGIYLGFSYILSTYVHTGLSTNVCVGFHWWWEHFWHWDHQCCLPWMPLCLLTGTPSLDHTHGCSSLQQWTWQKSSHCYHSFHKPSG